MSSVLYIGVLAILTVIGAEVAGTVAGGTVRTIGLGALAVAVLLAVALWLAIRGARLGGLVGRALVWVERRHPRLDGQLALQGQRFLTAVSEVRVSKATQIQAALLFAASWAADAGCLVACCQALGAPLPWTTLLMAYGAAQLLSFLPLTPGGVGLVEGSLAVSLVARAGGAAHIVSGVLLYRAFSYWATLPGGALGYAVVRRSGPVRGGEVRVGSTGWPSSTVSASPSST
jgi:uncharacterized protein (TIRG00374 family)